MQRRPDRSEETVVQPKEPFPAISKAKICTNSRFGANDRPPFPFFICTLVWIFVNLQIILHIVTLSVILLKSNGGLP